MLSPALLTQIQAELEKQSLDGWLLYDFRGLNSISGGLLGVEGLATRRMFAWIPQSGTPVAVMHAIEPGPWRHWPKEWNREIYSSWQTLEATVAKLIKGKRVAMEYSPGDAVPYLDRIPAGVIEMVRAAGAEVVTSGHLVSRFYAAWTLENMASHARSAEIIATIARDAFKVIGEKARSESPATEYEMMRWILDRFTGAGLETDHGPNVSAGPNSADPHYEPSAAKSRPIGDNEVVLIDLWATEKPGHPYADQTWMATVGPPSAKALEVWRTVRDARDAAIAIVVDNAAKQNPIPGAAADDAARRVISDRGFGQYFTHRTGHSIDARELHGSGPHLDNLESREERLLIPGVGFSIEPGVYIAGEFGMRSEVNVYVTDKQAVVTPVTYQKDLFVV
ncbi:MAG: M24 family metallopeptidase [Gemmatimonadaceae bacterium]